MTQKKEQPEKVYEPEFEYGATVEEPGLIKEVSQGMLEAPIALSNQELQLMSPDVCQNIKDLMTKKDFELEATAEFIWTNLKMDIDEEPVISKQEMAGTLATL